MRCAIAWLIPSVLALGCGRLGFDLLGVEERVHDGGAGGVAAGTGGSSDGGGGGAAGGDSGTSPAAGGAGDGGPPGSGGQPLDASGAGGQIDEAGAAGGQPSTDGQVGDAEGGDAAPYSCTPGAPELCDGHDNDCDRAIDEDGACPQGCSGTRWGSHGYMLCNSTNYSWEEARAECEGAGLVLARVDSRAENDFVNGFAFAARQGEVWLGGSDLVTEGDWRWTDGTPFWSGLASPAGNAVGGAYTHWYSPSEPDGLNGAQNAPGNCLSLHPLQDGAWIDQGCNYFRRALCRTP